MHSPSPIPSMKKETLQRQVEGSIVKMMKVIYEKLTSDILWKTESFPLWSGIRQVYFLSPIYSPLY